MRGRRRKGSDESRTAAREESGSRVIFRLFASVRRVVRELLNRSEFTQEWHNAIDRITSRSEHEGPHWSVTKAALEREEAQTRDRLLV